MLLFIIVKIFVIIIVIRTMVLIIVVLRDVLEQLVRTLPKFFLFLRVITIVIFEITFVGATTGKFRFLKLLTNSSHLKFAFLVLYIEVIIVIIESSNRLVTCRDKLRFS